MTLSTIPVHDFTRRWWATLPAAYKAADAQQAAPGLLYQVGFNSEPTFEGGLDGWKLTPIRQTETDVELMFTRAFFGIDPNLPVIFQAWWTADAAGTAITLELVDGAGRQLGRADLTNLPKGDGDETLVGGLGGVEPVTAKLTFSTPIDDGGLLFHVRGVNVGHQATTFEALPGNIVSMNYPLLRYMEGVGQIAGQIRDISDGLWSGEFIEPQNTPDTALRWVAQLMGVSKTIRDQSPAQLRAYLVNLAENGRPASGTRGDIANAAKLHLTGGRQAIMVPHPSRQHSIVVMVRADELPGADVDTAAALAGLVEKIRAEGVVPAGHELVAQIAAPTWDQWEAAAGPDWNTRDARARTWTEADSLGVTIEG